MPDASPSEQPRSQRHGSGDRGVHDQRTRWRISASEVGDYVYCARAAGLRRVMASADDPTGAALAAQGMEPLAGPAIAAFNARQLHRTRHLTAGRVRHQRHDRQLRLASGLATIGVSLIIMAVVLSAVELLPALR
jgi:hypothetical protein